MKKALVFLILIVTLLFCFTACKHEHKFSEWLTTTPATCINYGEQERTCSCGYVETRAVVASGQHNWENATCTSPKTCSECTATEGKALGHTFSEWTVSFAVDNTLKNLERACYLCEFKDIVKIEATPELVYTLLPDNTYQVEGIEDSGKEYVIISSEYNGLPVTSIGALAFNFQSMRIIIIPSSITTIGGSAFYGSNLQTIIFEKGISLDSIGVASFCDCLFLEHIKIPAGVKIIDSAAFSCCPYLESVVIPTSVTTIGLCAFSDCTSLESITFEGTVEQWSAIFLGFEWNRGVPATYVQCSDGSVLLK